MAFSKAAGGHSVRKLWAAYKLRWNRRRLLARSWHKRRQLTEHLNRTDQIKGGEILAFACVRNEITQLPYWLKHHRQLGVGHFLIVANDCTDGTVEMLAQEADVSVWTTNASYRLSRFGMDWLGFLQMRFGHNHWCLTLDADELLIYPQWDTRSLRVLTDWLDAKGRAAFGATMLDLFPKGKLSARRYIAGTDPTTILGWFDVGPYWAQLQPKLQNLWLQGGPRARWFFAQTPERAPTLNKIPLVRWSRRYTYVSSTHTMLPRALNHTYDEGGDVKTTGILLHTKFIDEVIAKATEEHQRHEHFGDPSKYTNYYDAIIDDPDLWHTDAVSYQGWQQLVALGLMEAGDWSDGVD